MEPRPAPPPPPALTCARSPPVRPPHLVYYWRLLTYTTKGQTPEPAASSDYSSQIDSESEALESHSDSGDDNDALGIEELKREVARLLERIPGSLEIDSDPESNDGRQPTSGTLATPGNCSSSDKQATIHSASLCVQADHKRRGRDRGRRGRDKNLLAKWPRGWGQDKVRSLLKVLYIFDPFAMFPFAILSLSLETKCVDHSHP